MERFFFDLTNGGETIRDEIGVEAPNLTLALGQAASVISEIEGENAASEPANGWMLIVKDATGAIVARLPLPRSCGE